MTIAPLELLDTSIGQLQTPVALLDDQLSWAEATAAETCACKEIATSLCSLIRTHEAAAIEASRKHVNELAKQMGTEATGIGVLGVSPVGRGSYGL